MKAEKLINFESTPWSGEERFTRMCDLYSRYTSIRDNNSNKVSWKTINKMYQRYSHKNANSPDDVNFGQFTFKVNSLIGSFEDILISRHVWARINTYEGADDREDASWSRIISSYFHRYAISTWVKKYLNIRHSVFDMVMYGKGAEHWPEKTGYMSENIPISSVLPDANAGNDPKEFDLLFIRKKFFSIGELFLIANDDNSDGYGWDIDAVKDIIRTAGSASTSKGNDAFYLLERGNQNPDITDTSVEVVYAYVKEHIGDAITMYVMPENGYLTVDSNNKPVKDEARFLRKVTKFAKCFDEIISIRTNLTARSYWGVTSLAEQMYASCKLYDKMMNKMIRAVIRNCILFLKSDSTEQQERLSNLTAEECQVLSPNDDIIQRQVAVDITGASQVLRQVMFDTDSTMGARLNTGSQNVKGRAITAAEAEIQHERAAEEILADVKMFMVCEIDYIKELYRRFCNLNSKDDGFKFLEKFKEKMKNNGIPDKAWSPENVVIEPYYNASLATPNGLAKAASTIIAALSRPPQSDGEHRATRDLIASAVGDQLADYYLEDRDYVDSDAWKAGMENEAMSNPDVSPKNVMVMPRDNHFIHMTFHLADALHTIEMCRQKFEMLKSSIEESKPVILHDLSMMIVSLDMKMSHMEAHIIMYSRAIKIDARAEPAINSFKGQMKQIRLKEQALENQLSAEMRERIQVNRQDLAMTMDLQFKQQMHQEELRYLQAVHDVKLSSNVEKVQFQQHAAKTRMDRKMQEEAITSATKVADAAQKLDASRKVDAAKIAKVKVELGQQVDSNKKQEE